MSQSNNLLNQVEAIEPHVGEFKRFILVFFSRKVVIISTAIIFILILVAIFAPLIAPYNPLKTHTSEVLAQPSSKYLLGTDEFGRDLLSRIIYGSRASLQVGIISVLVAASIGMTLGMVAGYFGKWLSIIIMRFIDALMAIPMIALALGIAAMLGGGLRNAMIAIGISLVPVYCRIMYGTVLSIKETDYVEAAHVSGASNKRIMLLYILPNCLPTLIVVITINLGFAILAEAGLSFLGIGVIPPEPAWGAMVSGGYQYLLSNPLLSLAPGLCIMLVVWSFNMIGDGLRDTLDPRLRGII